MSSWTSCSRARCSRTVPPERWQVRRVTPTIIEMVMGEGRKRLVRRLVAAVGGDVADLCRTRVGPIELGDLR